MASVTATAATASSAYGLRSNRVKQKFSEGSIALNTYIGLADPALVEIAALAGFDAVTIDLEHVTFHLELVRQMIVAAEATQVTPVIRVPPGAWDVALQVLDAGAQGIQVPHVCDRSTAEDAVNAVRYPPLGKRGALGISRVAQFGAVPWDVYAQWANEEILLIVMIEDAEALEHVEEIASVPGIDLITVGAHDLSESMGIRSPADPQLRAAVLDVIKRVRSVGNARMGFSIGHPVLPMTMSEVKDLGVAYANVLPPPEVRLRVALTELVREIKRDAEK